MYNLWSVVETNLVSLNLGLFLLFQTKRNSVLISAKGVFMKNNAMILAGFVGLVITGTTVLPVNAQSTKSTSGWFKACSENADSKICNVQIQNIASTGQTIVSVNLAEITGNVKRNVFQITVPTNRLIPPGIQMQVDDKKPSAIPYSFCMPTICAAEVALNDKLVDVLKGGKSITITTTNDRGKSNPIKVTLEGFGEAYDGEPVTRKDLAERQKKLAEQLEAQAKSKRDKLLEAQNAAKQNSQASE